MSEFVAWLTALLAMLVPSLHVEEERAYHGYVEADFVYVAAASAGRIDRLEVREGDSVEAGDFIFALESDSQAANLRSAEAREAAAEATWRNMETGSRVEEVAVIRASLSRAQADQHLAEVTLERSKKLAAQGIVPQAKVDTDYSMLESANAQLAQLKAQLAVAELPARDAQLVAAEASLDAARADADRARSELANRIVLAPAGGIIERVYFRAGEVASTGTPVIALLPPGELKARFFIPEADRSQFHLGDEMLLTCDGCASGMTAEITRLASDPQHTPPIIYSREERSRLVFMAEARLLGNADLLPGQPVSLQVLP